MTAFNHLEILALNMLHFLLDIHSNLSPLITPELQQKKGRMFYFSRIARLWTHFWTFWNATDISTKRLCIHAPRKCSSSFSWDKFHPYKGTEGKKRCLFTFYCSPTSITLAIWSTWLDIRQWNRVRSDYNPTMVCTMQFHWIYTHQVSRARDERITMQLLYIRCGWVPPRSVLFGQNTWYNTWRERKALWRDHQCIQMLCLVQQTQIHSIPFGNQEVATPSCKSKEHFSQKCCLSFTHGSGYRCIRQLGHTRCWCPGSSEKLLFSYVPRLLLVLYYAPVYLCTISTYKYATLK